MTKETAMQRSSGEIRALLAPWGQTAAQIQFIDSSHGSDDLRENYVLDRRLVLRINSADVMSDTSLAGLNRLIGRYRDFGVAAPLFLPFAEGRFVQRLPDGSICYLSEYLDMLPADQAGLKGRQWHDLDQKILILVARFAARYRQVDLIDTYGMYSLFDLSPYDIAAGIDEKQENCNLLTDALSALGEHGLAEDLTALNLALRKRLLSLSPRLPRCVFQGDENSSNLCLDEKGEIKGIFDFNMAGTDVCVNYLANHSLCSYENDFSRPAAALHADLQAAEAGDLQIIRRFYPMTPEEEIAYSLYLAIVKLFQWPMLCDYQKGLKQVETRQNALALLRLLLKDGQGLL